MAVLQMKDCPPAPSAKGHSLANAICLMAVSPAALSCSLCPCLCSLSSHLICISASPLFFTPLPPEMSTRVLSTCLNPSSKVLSYVRICFERLPNHAAQSKLFIPRIPSPSLLCITLRRIEHMLFLFCL